MALKTTQGLLVHFNDTRSIHGRRSNIIWCRKITFSVDHRRDGQSIGETSIEREFCCEKCILSAAADVRVDDGNCERQILAREIDYRLGAGINWAIDRELERHVLRLWLGNHIEGSVRGQVDG